MSGFNIRNYNLFGFKILAVFTLHILLIPCTYSNNYVPDSVYIRQLYDSAFENYQSGNYRTSTEQFEMILELKKEDDLYPEYYRVYNWLGVLNKKSGNIQLALYYFNKALGSTKDESFLPLTYNNIAIIYLLLGDYSKSINYYQRALNLLNHSKNDDINYIKNSIYHNLGNTYLNAGQLENSLSNFFKSIQIADKYGIKGIEETYFNTGLVYQKLKKLDEAEKYYKLSIKSYLADHGNDYYLTAMAQIYYASLLAEKHDFVRSFDLAGKAFNTLFKTLGEKHPYTSECLETIGNIWFKKNDFKKALVYYQKALIARVRNFNDTSVYANPGENIYPDIDLIDLLKAKALAFERLASVEHKKQNLIAALSTYKTAALYIEKLRTGYLSEESKLYISSNEYTTHLFVIRIAENLYRLTGETTYRDIAFEYAERSKYGVLHELVNDEKAKSFAGVPDTIAGRERELKEKINNCRLLINEQNKNTNPDTAKINVLENTIFNLSREQEELIRKMELDYPAYFRLKYKNDVIAPEELKNTLAPCEVLVEYVLTDSLLYTFLCTKDTFMLQTLMLDTGFFSSLDFYNKYLHGENIMDMDYDSFRIASYALYKALVKPVEPYSGNKSLIFVPDVNMGLMSFESLINEPYKKEFTPDLSDDSYLIKKYPIGYANSATLLAGSKQKGKSRRMRFAGFAPTYDREDSHMNFPEGLKRTRRIAHMLFGRAYTGDKATEQKFKGAAGKYELLQFFAHGQDDKKNPSFSRMYLTVGHDSTEDGVLYAYEVSNMNINPELVVLASCYSGSGSLTKGEGVLSMGRAFFNAGSKSVVTSLWGAPVEPALEELTAFYKLLLLGKRKDVAMQQAKLKYLKHSRGSLRAHPAVWANLVVIGNQDAVYKNVLLKKIAFPVAVMLLIVLFLVYRKRFGKVD